MATLRVCRFVPLVGLAVALGCGASIPMAEVEGTLKQNGRPLDKIQVEFWPEGSGPRSIGVTDASGHYTLKTDDGKRTGASVGKHRVVLSDIGTVAKFLGRKGEGEDATKGKKPRINAKYSSAAQAAIVKEVSPGKNTIDLESTP